MKTILAYSTSFKLTLPNLFYVAGDDERTDEQSNWEIPELNFKQSPK